MALGRGAELAVGALPLVDSGSLMVGPGFAGVELGSFGNTNDLVAAAWLAFRPSFYPPHSIKNDHLDGLGLCRLVG